MENDTLDSQQIETSQPTDPQIPNFAPVPEKPKKNHSIAVISLAIFILACFGVIGFFYYQNQELKKMILNYEPSPSPSPTGTLKTEDLQVEVFSDEGLSFEYPSDFEVKESQNPLTLPDKTQVMAKRVHLSKWGPTQKAETEGYDLISLSFTLISKGNFELEDIVDDKLKEAKASEDLEVTSDKKAISVNNYPGFTFATKGMAETVYTYLSNPIETYKYYLLIEDSTMDPGNLGFEDTVSQIISTLEMK